MEFMPQSCSLFIVYRYDVFSDLSFGALWQLSQNAPRGATVKFLCQHSVQITAPQRY